MLPIQEILEPTRKHLRECVKEAGFTQEALAARLKVSRTTVSNVLRSEGRGFTLERLLMILQVIGVSPRDFFATLYGLAGPDLETRFSALLDILLQKGVIARGHLRSLRKDSSE